MGSVPRPPCIVRGVGEIVMAVNVGSVGPPRRLGDSRASYVLHDGDTVELRRVEYDWRATAAKLAGLPVDAETIAELCERLEKGAWWRRSWTCRAAT